jgi:hypothetical protein
MLLTTDRFIGERVTHMAAGRSRTLLSSDSIESSLSNSALLLSAFFFFRKEKRLPSTVETTTERAARFLTTIFFPRDSRCSCQEPTLENSKGLLSARFQPRLVLAPRLSHSPLHQALIFLIYYFYLAWYFTFTATCTVSTAGVQYERAE